MDCHINEGIAVDASLVKSVSHPVSQKELKELIQKEETPEENRDNNCNK